MKRLLAFLIVLALAFSLLAGCSFTGVKSVKLDNKEALEATLFSPNQCDISFGGDGVGNAAWLTVNTDYASDPFCNFNFKQYLEMTGRGAVRADEYPYVVLKIKTKNCSGNNFWLFVNVDGVLAPLPDLYKNSYFDNSTEDWCYVCFDFSEFGLTGEYSYFRFDFEVTAVAAGEACCIGEMLFAKTEADAIKLLTVSSADKGLTAEEKKAVEKMLATYGTEAPAEYKSYKAKKAPLEDAGVVMKFNHSFTRIAEEDKSASGTDTYCLYMAKNELESCQLVLTGKEAREGLTLEVSDFVHSDGASKLPVEVFEGYYFEVEGEHVIDPTPPLAGSFGVEKNKSKSFVIKTGTGEDSKDGSYKATVNVKNSSGDVIKTADIFAYVWNFTLPEATSCKTMMDLSWYSIYMYHECYEGDGGLLYKLYYDLLLENRICSYNIPYNSADGLFTDDRVIEYLDNPRVTAFQALNFKTDLTDANVAAAYNYLSQKQEWLDKAYFYPIDEPLNVSMLNQVNKAGQILKNNFPGYKLITPVCYDEDLAGDGSVDFFEYIKESETVWCPHNFFYSTWKDYQSNPKTYIGISPIIERKLGEFPERMKKEQEEGDEVWWYVTRVPNDPEATVLINCNPVGSREIFWLQSLYDIDGFLYYLSNDWAFRENNYGVDPKFEIVNGTVKSYGNGVLVYCGKPFGINGPVGSLRLEVVRDGIEDFEYLTMLRKVYGDENTDLIIRSLAVSLTDWNGDADSFAKTRIALGGLLNGLLNNK